ncbi:MAG TPA: ATP-binding protein [Pyrinomonadaceae bacterium]|nr:ATP-binding protein [Pyrinomonadaceae bacterium]
MLFIQSSDRELATRIERLFAGWQLTPLSSLERNPDIKITFTTGKRLPEVPVGLKQFEVAEGGRCYTSDDEYYLQFGSSLLRLQEKNPVSVSVFTCGPTNAELARVTSFAVCAGLRRFGMFELHGAGVVEPNSEVGALIVGPSGTGKSTLTTQLARAGWSYLSDDELLLSLNDNKVEARGFRSFFALVDSGSTLKNCFEPADMFTSSRVDKIAPRFVFFTKISGERDTQARKLTQPETMTRLIRACPWAIYDTAIAGANLELLSRLARQAKGFELAAGKDLLEPETASRIISSACHHQDKR